jgi:light-regulated signal transduction histidine kinase (bacteriophytochrome)
VAEADPGLLRLILRELLGNAWKFTRRVERAHVEVGALDAGGERAFFVRDDGVGFDMKYAQHLFGVFQRMHAAEDYEGDGVGLATVQRLVRRHGGRVWAEAEVDQGASFFFTLPGASAGA